MYCSSVSLIPRLLLPSAKESFFLWGPRQTGKTSLLRELYPTTWRIDLLLTDEFAKYSVRPSLLREEALRLPRGSFIIVDEIQKTPALLDEVHWLIENHDLVFGLCGSSARKLKRLRANMLGGRAMRYELFGLVSAELGDAFDIRRAVNHGGIPRAYLHEQPELVLNSYVSDYLKNEIADEGAVRNLPAFSDFLRIAAVSDTEIVNFTNIASDCGVSRDTAAGYFQILEDTLLGRFLPAYTRRAKRRTVQAPRWYMADVGIVNFLARRHSLEPAGELFGKAFENWIFHEIVAYSAYRQRFSEFSYWRLSSGAEVDFIVNDMELAIECKAVPMLSARHLKGLREVKKDYPSIKRRIVVSMEPKSRVTEDKIEVLSLPEFLGELWGGEIF